MSQDLQINPYNFHQPYNHVENPFSTINTTYRQMGSTYMDNLDQYYPSPYNFMSFSESFLLPAGPDHDTNSSGFGFNYIAADNEEKQQEIYTKKACASENDHQVTTNSTMEGGGGVGDEDSNTCNNMKIKGSQEDEESPKKESKKSKKKLGTEKKKEKQSRFAFMTKSEIDNLEDGYRWRKYGQKAVKNSPYPRSYYRCTTQKCTVKKRVERSLQDPTIVITTYEGTHNHHVPSNLRGNINVAAGLLYPRTPHHAAAGSSFLPELFVQMQQAYGHGGGGGVTTSSGSGSNSNSNSSMHHHQQTLTTPFQHMQFSDCGLLQDIVPSSIFLKQEH